MPYDSLITRSDAGALIPEQVSKAMLGAIRQESAALTMFARVPVARAQVRFPVLSALPVAYFVNGDTGLKQTTEVAWANKYLNIEEVACIVPVPENVLSDTDIDVWSEIKPSIETAIARTIDAGVFFGTNAPSSWPTYIQSAAASASNTTAEDGAASAGGIQDDIDTALEVVEADGYDATGIVAARSLKGRLRRARATDGQRLSGVNDALTEYSGLPIAYPMRGQFPSGLRAFVGDWTQFVAGVRQDISYKVLDQAVITDNTGTIIYNLAQQDMVALRVVTRLGWQVANVINYDNQTEATRYPVCNLTYTP